MERYLDNLDIPVFIHDFEKDIGLPEHLDDIAINASKFSPRGIDFDSFTSGLKAIAKTSKGAMSDISSKESFSVWFDDHSAMHVESHNSKLVFDEEDLHSAWVSLLRGLVTKERAEWSTGSGGNFVVTILSLLPTTRPVEIEKYGETEVAVELAPWARSIGATQHTSDQLKLPWH